MHILISAGLKYPMDSTIGSLFFRVADLWCCAELKLVTCDIDRGLTYDGFVYPGIGNFGDRYYGTGSDDARDLNSPSNKY